MAVKMIEIRCHVERSDSKGGGVEGVFTFLLYSQVSVDFRAVKYKSTVLVSV